MNRSSEERRSQAEDEDERSHATARPKGDGAGNAARSSSR